MEVSFLHLEISQPYPPIFLKDQISEISPSKPFSTAFRSSARAYTSATTSSRNTLLAKLTFHNIPSRSLPSDVLQPPECWKRLQPLHTLFVESFTSPLHLHPLLEALTPPLSLPKGSLSSIFRLKTIRKQEILIPAWAHLYSEIWPESWLSTPAGFK